MKRLRALGLLSVTLTLVCVGCKDDSKPQGGPPPPVSSTPPAGAADVCASGGGEDNDPVSAPYFPRTVGEAGARWCIDPHEDAKTYGEKGKLAIKLICDTALDGGCEEYLKAGVTRTVILHYVEGKGKGSVEVFLSQFAADGAYQIMTQRIVGEVDPTDPHMPRPMKTAGVGALGTGKAYAWRGAQFLELTYSNDEQTPEQLKKSSDEILPKLAEAIAAKLPDAPAAPAAASALPEADRVPLGVMYYPKAVLGMVGFPGGAVGYYKKDNKRWRVITIAPADVDGAKDALKTLRQPGNANLAGVGDEAITVTLRPGPSRPKLELAFARKGKLVIGVGDEELLLSAGGPAPPPTAKAGEATLAKDEKVAKLKELVAAIK